MGERSNRPSLGISRYTRARARWLLVALTTAGLLAVAPAAMAANTSDTWTGGSTTSTNWSDPTNWSAGAPTPPTVYDLTFPGPAPLTCGLGGTACYTSTNDITGLTVGTLNINDASQLYNISGNAITLDNGITVTGKPAGSGYATVALPITLGGTNTWAIGAAGENDHLVLGSNTAAVTGSQAVNVTFAGSGSILSLAGNVDVGAVTVSGRGTVAAYSSLNGTSHNSVTVNGGATLNAPFDGGHSGPLTVSGSTLQVGHGVLTGTPTPKDGTLTVFGATSLDSTSSAIFYLDQAGTSPGADYSQLIGGTGGVSLGSSTLSLRAGTACTSLGYGDVDTIVSSPSGLTGTFGNAPAGTVLPVTCGSTTYQVRIDYTGTTVTATVLTPTTTTLAASNSSPTTGSSVTYTASVAPAGATGTVGFADNGTPISGCTAQPLTSGTATCTVSYPGAGSHTIKATYNPTGNYLSSASNTLSVNVQQSGGGPAPPPAGVTATTLAASGVNTTASTLNGSVGTGGRTVTWQFQYGTSTHYDKATPIQTISAGQSGSIPVKWTLSKLAPNTRYHYRLVVTTQSSPTGAVGEATGNDLTFTTRSTGKLLMLSRNLSIFGRTILVPLKCGSNLRCDGRFSITTTAKIGKKHKLGTVLCTTKFVRIKRHRVSVVRARITTACLSLIRHKRGHRMGAKFTSRPRTGQLGLIEKIILTLR